MESIAVNRVAVEGVIESRAAVAFVRSHLTEGMHVAFLNFGMRPGEIMKAVAWLRREGAGRWRGDATG